MTAPADSERAARTAPAQHDKGYRPHATAYTGRPHSGHTTSRSGTFLGVHAVMRREARAGTATLQGVSWVALAEKHAAFGHGTPDAFAGGRAVKGRAARSGGPVERSRRSAEVNR